MNHCEAQSRSAHARRRSLVVIFALAIAVVAGQARAKAPFRWGGEPIHPACIHALAMHQGDTVPVTTAVSLEGCASSERGKIKVRYEGMFAVFEDEAILGGGSFGYSELSQLENGIFGLAIRRVLPDGGERVSLAAVKIVQRPMLRGGRVIQVQLIELLGELWVPGMELLSFRSSGNTVYFRVGSGRDKVERTVDLSRIGRMRK